MKRIISVLAVTGLTAAVLAASAMPAFAAKQQYYCVGTNNTTGEFQSFGTSKGVKGYEKQGLTCTPWS
jgi:hypothetical protein